MKNSKISARLIVGFGILILFIIAQSIVSVIGVRNIRTLNQIVENANQKIILLDKLRKTIENISINAIEVDLSAQNLAEPVNQSGYATTQIVQLYRK